MKHFKRLSAIIFAAVLLMGCLPILASLPAKAAPAADEAWRSDLRRMNDLSEILSDTVSDDINSRACDMTVGLRFDFVIIMYNDTHRGTDADLNYINYIYNKNQLGYGPDHDGIVLAMNTDDLTVLMEAFGRGAVIFTDSVLSGLMSSVRQAYSAGRYESAITVFLDEAGSIVEGSPIGYSAESIYTEDYVTYSSVESLTVSEMPPWYPADVNSWTYVQNDPSTPRVVDNAGILTDDEEAKLEARIREVAPTANADIVIFTDVSTHGLSRAVYAADFYMFNGYGYGATQDGFCLFLCMDPASRGGWCCVTGAPRAYYSEANANALDDVLYDYLGRGEYYTGIYDWIGNIGTLMDKGIPFAPEWYPSVNEEPARTQDPNAPRIVDDSHVLTDAQIAALREKAAKISQKYGVDVVIHTTNTSYGLSEQNYTNAFYRYNGYGIGDNYDGALLTLFTDGSGDACMYPDEDHAGRFTPANVRGLLNGVKGPALVGDYYKAADRWLSYLDKTLKTGRTPKTPGVWALRSAIAGVVSVLASAVHMETAKTSMRTVRTAYEAGDHLVRDSMRMMPSRDDFVNNTVTRVYSPVARESGGGSGHSGGSSYSGGYSSSSGSSHSGSGRDF
jgi:uncharacterized membrane protein YgcG